MKVLQVIDTLNIGGAEQVFVDLTNSLSASGVHVEVMVFHKIGKLVEQLNESLQVHVLNRSSKLSLTKAYKAHQLCKKFEIVHVHMRHCYAYIKAVQLLFKGKYKIILHDHYGDIEINKSVPFRLRYRLKPSYYIGVSHSLTNWAQNILKVDKVYLLRNVFQPSDAVKYEQYTGNKAIMIANIRKTKNIEFAIALCDKLGMELDIYGNSTDAAYTEYLHSLIIGKRTIRIIEGVLDFSELYSNYSLGIHTAVSETGPLVLLQYLAYGIPFISYKTGEVAAVAADELPLHFVDSFDLAEWEERIAGIKREGNITEKFKAVFEKNFNIENYRQKCLRIYQDVSC